MPFFVEENMIFTSEQVSMGHPDKICDQISDAILTDCLKHDKASRVAVETLIKDDKVIVAGEVTTNHYYDTMAIVNSVLEPLGMLKFHLIDLIGKQSRDIAQGVDSGGAGDQGLMFGYATDETKELLPIPYVLATKALLKLKDLDHPLLGLDAKAQVSYDYVKKRIDTFLISTQHKEEASLAMVTGIVSQAMLEVAKDHKLNTDFKMLVNPTGRFVLGGSHADAGVTGRKIIADTYGGVCRHGGGAFSGKDPSKVDRSGAYMARKIACDLVREKIAKRCEVQIAYAIGKKEPVSIYVNTFGTSDYSDDNIVEMIRVRYDLSPRGIIEELDLLNVDYTKTTCYGHFGKADLPWEV